MSDDDRTLKTLVQKHVDRVLEETGGNKTAAGRILGVSRWTLLRIMRGKVPLFSGERGV